MSNPQDHPDFLLVLSAFYNSKRQNSSSESIPTPDELDNSADEIYQQFIVSDPVLNEEFQAFFADFIAGVEEEDRKTAEPAPPPPTIPEEEFYDAITPTVPPTLPPTVPDEEFWEAITPAPPLPPTIPEEEFLSSLIPDEPFYQAPPSEFITTTTVTEEKTSTEEEELPLPDDVVQDLPVITQKYRIHVHKQYRRLHDVLQGTPFWKTKARD